MALILKEKTGSCPGGAQAPMPGNFNVIGRQNAFVGHLAGRPMEA
jgi:hypothetical protein